MKPHRPEDPPLRLSRARSSSLSDVKENFVRMLSPPPKKRVRTNSLTLINCRVSLLSPVPGQRPLSPLQIQRPEYTPLGNPMSRSSSLWDASSSVLVRAGNLSPTSPFGSDSPTCLPGSETTEGDWFWSNSSSGSPVSYTEVTSSLSNVITLHRIATLHFLSSSLN